MFDSCRKSTRLPIAAVLLGVVLCASTAAAQEQLQFNVPYHCPDGTDNIITKCVSNPRGQVCYWREEKNGQLIVERYNIRSQMDGWLKICKVQSAQPGKPTAPASQPAAAPSRPGQPLNPPYLSEMPTVERVKSEIQGANPTDTLARQVAVFTYLPAIVERRRDPNRSVRDPMTPDEQRIVGAYRLAAYEMSQAYAKTHTPEEAKGFERAHGRYEMDSAFYQLWFNKLFSPEFRAGYGQVQKADAEHAQAHVDAERRDQENAKAQAAAAAKGQGQFARNDPGTLAVRRCLELGGNELECVGKGLATSVIDLAGVNPNLFKNPVRAGLRITGFYKGDSGIGLVFSDETAGLNGCGKLVEQGHGYTVVKDGNVLLIKLGNSPQPFVLALGPDGRMTGPGPTTVNGRVIVGYENTWVEQRLVSDNTVVPGSGHWVQTPIYQPKTEVCRIGVLPAAGSTSSAGSALVAVLSSLTSKKSVEEAARDAAKNATPPGPRLVGEYAGQGGFRAEFQTDTVILDCGEAHVRQLYTVVNTATQILVTVKNGATPFTLALQPDGTLVGSGAVDIAGRAVTGANDNGVTYAPRNARCSVGTLVPK